MNTFNEETNKRRLVHWIDQTTRFEIEALYLKESFWMTQEQIAELFGTKRPAITKHLRNVFKTAELREKSVCSILEHTATDGKIYQTKYYNLDAIIAVGYRVNSKRATWFRMFATDRLRKYILEGYIINEKRLRESQITKLKELETAHKLIQQALESKRSEGYEKELLKIITDYANTWFVLNLYDEEKLKIENVSERKSKGLVYDEVLSNIKRFRARLQAQKQATDLFGVEVSHKLSSVIGGIEQTFGGKYKRIRYIS